MNQHIALQKLTNRNPLQLPERNFAAPVFVEKVKYFHDLLVFIPRLNPGRDDLFERSSMIIDSLTRPHGRS